MTTTETARQIPINLYRSNSPLNSKLLSNTRLTPEDEPDVRHLVFEVAAEDFRYLEGQSVGIVPPLLDKDGKPCKLRLYSIASARDGDAGDGKTLTLCVKRVVFKDEDGREVKGPCSNYLCDLESGEEVRMTGPVGRNFLLPEDPEANLIMLATGTGIAPFRGFLRRLFRSGSPYRGQARLFFGVPYSGQMLYREELEAFQAAQRNFEAHWAISREQKTADGQRMYVQHRLLEQGEALWPLIEAPNTTFYICGLKGMETGIMEALGQIAARHGVDWEARRDALKKAGRWHVETY